MSGEAGTQMPEHEIDFDHCGTNVAGWLNGIHPEAVGKVIYLKCYKNILTLRCQINEWTQLALATFSS